MVGNAFLSFAELVDLDFISFNLFMLSCRPNTYSLTCYLLRPRSVDILSSEILNSDSGLSSFSVPASMRAQCLKVSLFSIWF